MQWKTFKAMSMASVRFRLEILDHMLVSVKICIICNFLRFSPFAYSSWSAVFLRDLQWSAVVSGNLQFIIFINDLVNICTDNIEFLSILLMVQRCTVISKTLYIKTHLQMVNFCDCPVIEKHCESLLGVHAKEIIQSSITACSKRDHLILNNGKMCSVAFVKILWPLIISYKYYHYCLEWFSVWCVTVVYCAIILKNYTDYWRIIVCARFSVSSCRC